MKNPSPYPLVYVEWTDAYANSEWMTLKENEDVMRAGDMTIHEIGWLIKKTPRYILLASRYNSENEQYGLWQLIPKTWCTITVLSVASMPRRKRKPRPY